MERRYFLLEENIPATEAGRMMGRVVTSRTLPLAQFAPFPPIAANGPSHHTNDIIPSILPEPSLHKDWKESISATQGKEVHAALTSFFGADLTRQGERSVSVQSQQMKRYALQYPELFFNELLKNPLYAQDVRSILEAARFNRAYFVTGFLIASGTVWNREASLSRSIGVTVGAPISEIVPVALPGLLDVTISPGYNSSSRHNKEMTVQEEVIFAVSYSAVKLSRTIGASLARPITKSIVLGAPKRAKARHLAFTPDSDEELDGTEDFDEDEGSISKDGSVRETVALAGGTSQIVMISDEEGALLDDASRSFSCRDD